MFKLAEIHNQVRTASGRDGHGSACTSARLDRLTGLASIAAICIATLLPGALDAHAGGYETPRYSMEGTYFGVLGQYSHANAQFVWDTATIFDKDTGNWGVSGLAGHGWKSGSFYFGGEIFVDYANIKNVLAQTVTPVSQLTLERKVGAGANLLAGVTAFDDRMLTYGLVGVGATNFSGSITVSNASLKGDVWYPVLSLGAGADWAIAPSLSVRVQGKHTFYYDVSDRIFPDQTSQSYDFDTTSVSVGLIWRPWN
ncbi:MAG: hypothetical protein V2I51_04675 [Anderseniella sp.]|jgi:opacity protein-like surface antigen|nr:hypothetical protein [Anderseniella sp.]